jgi:hypothetical protein
MRIQPWWPQVQRQTAEWYSSRGAAVDAEIAAIRNEGPRHNILHATSAGLNVLTLKGTWTCAACKWTTEDPVEQVRHMEREVIKLAQRAPSEDIERLSRAVAGMRLALDRTAVLSIQTQTLFQQLASPHRKASYTMSSDEARKLLADLDEILGEERIRLADVPGLLRQHDPTWVPYQKLAGIHLRAALKKHGIRVTNTGNVPRLDPADLRIGRPTAA